MTILSGSVSRALKRSALSGISATLKNSVILLAAPAPSSAAAAIMSSSVFHWRFGRHSNSSPWSLNESGVLVTSPPEPKSLNRFVMLFPYLVSLIPSGCCIPLFLLILPNNSTHVICQIAVSRSSWVPDHMRKHNLSSADKAQHMSSVWSD